MIKELHKQYFYCGDKGYLLSYTKTRGLRRVEGKNLGGYLKTRFQGKYYKAHRVCWALVFGKFPNKDLDHINGDKTDNRICNLREVSRRANNSNRKSHREGKLIGAYKEGKTWRSKILVDGITYNLGRFNSAEEANAAYLKIAKHLKD